MPKKVAVAPNASLSQVNVDKLIEELRCSPNALKGATSLLRRDLPRFLADNFLLTPAWEECLGKLKKSETEIVGRLVAEAIESGGRVTLKTDPKLKTGDVRVEFRSRRRKGVPRLRDEVKELERKADALIRLSSPKVSG